MNVWFMTTCIGIIRKWHTHFNLKKVITLKKEGFNILIKTKKALISESFFVGLLGLEPRKTAPKTVVLPLHHRPICFALIA